MSDDNKTNKELLEEVKKLRQLEEDKETRRKKEEEKKKADLKFVLFTLTVMIILVTIWAINNPIDWY
tara:strand:- start:369 stop:569 length:201 start_codon:yes stop_codon:yes gene_type:complete